MRFLIRNETFFARSRKPGTRPKSGESKQRVDKSRDCAEASREYVAQAIPKIDAEIVKPGTRPERVGLSHT